MNLQMLAVFFLVAVAAGGVAWVFLYPSLSGERKAEQRRESVARAEPTARRTSGRNAPKSRREQVEETLKELEDRSKKAKSLPLSMRIAQAGLTWSKQKFFIISAALGIAAFLVTILAGGGLLAAGPIGFAAGLGLPRWILSFLKNRRELKFIDAFPDSVDIIVRGI